jgi:hypothetical protein
VRAHLYESGLRVELAGQDIDADLAAFNVAFEHYERARLQRRQPDRVAARQLGRR